MDGWRCPTILNGHVFVVNSDEISSGPKLLLGFVFAFGMWSALVLGIGGRACSSQFSWPAAVEWLQLYTLLGFLYWVPLVAVLTGLAYAGMSRLRFVGRPIPFILIGTAIIVCTFAIAALLTHKGPCIWP